MRERTLKTIYLLFALVMAFSLCTAVCAKGKKVTKKAAKTYSVKVPASILNGSDVTANRSFKNLNVKETTLAGIKLGDSNKKVLEKYGNPTRIIVHSEPVQQNNGMGGMPGMPGMNNGMPGMGGMPGMDNGMPGMNNGMPGMNNGMPGMGGMPGMNNGMPGMGGMPGMNNDMPGMGGMPGMNNGMPGMGGMPGMNNDMPGMNNGMPGMNNGMPGMNNDMPGMNNGMPGMNNDMPGMNNGMPGMGGMPGMMGDGMGMMGQNMPRTPAFFGTSTRIASTSICWQYDLPSGVQVEFIVKDGKVSQITVLSLYPWKLATLKSGLMIGDTYKLVTYIWGVNYKQQQIGSFTRMTYWDKKGVALIFLNKKLVGMTVAAGDPII